MRVSLEPSAIISIAAQTFFLVVAVMAARAGRRCVTQNRREDLGPDIFWSITWTTWLAGPLLFGAVLVLFLWDSPGDTGGIMSRNMGVAVMCIGAFLMLALFWASAIALGAIAARIARDLPGKAAVAVIFGVVTLSPLLCTSNFMGRTADQRRAAAQGP
ncbi:MAG: hypothetical protein ACJ790_22740 [Myxococcaceae bacterium]